MSGTLSSEELTDILLHIGARVVSRHEYGDFLAVRRRLVFVHRAAVVRDLELQDVLRSTGVARARLQQLLAELRAAREQVATPAHPVPTPRR